MLLLFIVFSQLGAATGRAVFEREQTDGFTAYPRVKVWLKEKEDERAKEWAGGCYRMLLHDKANLYFFPVEQFKDQMLTESIPNSLVASVRRLPWPQSTDECQ